MDRVVTRGGRLWKRAHRALYSTARGAAAPRRRPRGPGAAGSAAPAGIVLPRVFLGGHSSFSSRGAEDFVKDIPSFQSFLEEDRERRAGKIVRDALSSVGDGADESAQLTDLCGRQHSYLRLSLTEKCNLRCRYCMPEEGIPLRPRQEMLTADELVEIARHFNSHGVDKIRLTGGEPLVNREIGSICRELGALPGMKTLAITTNGIKLPRKLPSLLDSGEFRKCSGPFLPIPFLPGPTPFSKRC